MSIADDVAAEILSVIGGLGLTVDGAGVTLSQRKLPAVDEALDSLPMLVLAPSDGPDDDAPFDTGTDGTSGRRLQEYVYDGALIAKGNRDYAAALADYRAARQAISLRFGRARPLATAGVLYVVPEPVPPLVDRSLVAGHYDYSSLRLRVGVVVSA